MIHPCDGRIEDRRTGDSIIARYGYMLSRGKNQMRVCDLAKKYGKNFLSDYELRHSSFFVRYDTEIGNSYYVIEYRANLYNV